MRIQFIIWYLLCSSPVLGQLKDSVLNLNVKQKSKEIHSGNRRKKLEDKSQYKINSYSKSTESIVNWQTMKRNSISLIPISFCSDLGNQRPDKSTVGIGIAYERFVSKKVSLRLPIETAFNNSYNRVALTLKLFPAGIQSTNYVLGISAFRYSNLVQGYCYSDYGFVESMYGKRTSMGITMDQILDIWLSPKFFTSFTFGTGFNLQEYTSFPRVPVYWDKYYTGYGDFSFLNIYINCSISYNF